MISKDGVKLRRDDVGVGGENRGSRVRVGARQLSYTILYSLTRGVWGGVERSGSRRGPFPPRARRRVNRNGRAFRLRPLTRRRARFGVESPVLWASRRPPSRYGRLCITGRRMKRRLSMATTTGADGADGVDALEAAPRVTIAEILSQEASWDIWNDV